MARQRLKTPAHIYPKDMRLPYPGAMFVSALNQSQHRDAFRAIHGGDL
jgi:hypothetical protein